MKKIFIILIGTLTLTLVSCKKEEKEQVPYETLQLGKTIFIEVSGAQNPAATTLDSVFAIVMLPLNKEWCDEVWFYAKFQYKTPRLTSTGVSYPLTQIPTEFYVSIPRSAYGQRFFLGTLDQGKAVLNPATIPEEFRLYNIDYEANAIWYE